MGSKQPNTLLSDFLKRQSFIFVDKNFIYSSNFNRVFSNRSNFLRFQFPWSNIWIKEVWNFFHFLSLWIFIDNRFWLDWFVAKYHYLLIFMRKFHNQRMQLKETKKCIQKVYINVTLLLSFLYQLKNLISVKYKTKMGKEVICWFSFWNNYWNYWIFFSFK